MIKAVPLVLMFLVLAFLVSSDVTSTHASNQQDANATELQEAAKLMDLANEAYKGGRYNEGVTAAKRALEIRERLLAADNELIDASINSLAKLYLNNADFKESRTQFNRVLERKQQRVGSDNETLVATLDNLALVNFRLREFKKSEELYLRSLKIREAKFGVDSFAASEGLYYLGEYYRMKGESARALKMHNGALRILGQLRDTKEDRFQKVSLSAWCTVFQAENYPELRKPHADFMKQFTHQNDSPESNLEIMNGKALSLPRPKFPAAAMGLSGIVVVKLLIGDDGKVIKAGDMCGANPDLAAASVQAALQSRFSVTEVNGKPIQFLGVVVYRFISTDGRIVDYPHRAQPLRY